MWSIQFLIRVAILTDFFALEGPVYEISTFY